jgi:hypothetical protein
MAIQELVQASVVMLIAFAIIAIVLWALRSKLTPRTPIFSAVLGAIVTTGILGAVASAIGISFSVAPAWLLVGIFAGFVGIQPKPWTTPSLLRGLAVVAGAVSVLAALESNLLVVILAIGVAGILLELSGSERARSRGGGDAA